MLKEYVGGLSEAKRDRFFTLLAYAFEEWNNEYALEEQRIYEEFAKSFSEFKKNSSKSNDTSLPGKAPPTRK